MAKSSTSFSSEYWTPERKAALAQKNRERVYTPELRAKLVRDVHHSAETRAKMSKTRTGMKYSKEFCEINSRVSKEHAAKNLPNCGCAAHAGRIRPRVKTSIENILVKTVLKEFPKVVREKQFGRYRVDAYLPAPYHLAFEADGEYWHAKTEEARPGYYARRDAYLMEKFGLTVIRLSEAELRRVA